MKYRLCHVRKPFWFYAISLVHVHALSTSMHLVIYPLDHNVKCVPPCGSKSEKVRPSHYSVILVYRYLNAFAPMHLPLSQMTQITRQ